MESAYFRPTYFPDIDDANDKTYHKFLPMPGQLNVSQWQKQVWN
jgi:hypothetical protein